MSDVLIHDFMILLLYYSITLFYGVLCHCSVALRNVMTISVVVLRGDIIDGLLSAYCFF